MEVLIYRQSKDLPGEDVAVLPPIPFYVTEGSGAMDVAAFLPSLKSITIPPNAIWVVPTGLHFRLPPWTGLRVQPRSGLSLKKIRLANAPGLLDSDYVEELGILLHNMSDQPFVVNDGDRVAQIMLEHIERIQFSEVKSKEALGTTERKGGFGHTGTGWLVKESNTLEEVANGQNKKETSKQTYDRWVAEAGANGQNKNG